MSVTVKDELPNVPRLEPDGSNWVIFKTRLTWTLADCQVLDHLSSSKAPKPTAPDQLIEWEKAENKARNLLAQRLADSTLRKVFKKDTVAKMWTTISDEFEKKTSLVQSDLRAKFQSLRCPKRGDLRTHLDKMSELWEELCAVGVTISDEEHSSILIEIVPRPRL